MRIFTRSQHGFTLIEMIISLAIFAVVAVVALGALVKIISANKKAQTLQASISNLNFALESISRELRVGKNYHCETYVSGVIDPGDLYPETCIIGTGNLIMFQSSRSGTRSDNVSVPCNLATAYWFSGSNGEYVLQKAEQRYCDDTFGGTSGNSVPFTPVIAPNISINSFVLSVTKGIDDVASPYPLAYIRISGYAGAYEREKERSYFEVQTSVSSRLPFIP